MKQIKIQFLLKASVSDTTYVCVITKTQIVRRIVLRQIVVVVLYVVVFLAVAVPTAAVVVVETCHDELTKLLLLF